VGNVYIILKQIYSGNGLSNFITIASFIGDITKKTFWSLFFLDTVYISHVTS